MFVDALEPQSHQQALKELCDEDTDPCVFSLNRTSRH